MLPNNISPCIKHEEIISNTVYKKHLDCFELDPTPLHKSWHKLINSENTTLKAIRDKSWFGIPYCIKGYVWMILSDHIPLQVSSREAKLNQKRQEYFNLVEKYYETRLNDKNKQIFYQIEIDIPRTYPQFMVIQDPILARIMSRVLYTWAVRHPTSSYVQGLNDLLCMLLLVFFWPFFGDNVATSNLSTIDPADLKNIEADSYWMLKIMLDDIQDNYTSEQPGIRRKLILMIELMKKCDVQLYNHLEKYDVNISQFAFRWINNLSIRELNFECCLRLWDILWSEELNGFSEFHIYFCSSLLCSFSSQILALTEFHDIIMFLQNLPTKSWSISNISQLASVSFVVKHKYENKKDEY